VSGLRLALLDEGGEPVAHEVRGKMNVSWRSGSKKAAWSGDPLRLPPVQVGGPLTRRLALAFAALPSSPL
jgi:hypothetical protein